MFSSSESGDDLESSGRVIRVQKSPRFIDPLQRKKSAFANKLCQQAGNKAEKPKPQTFQPSLPSSFPQMDFTSLKKAIMSSSKPAIEGMKKEETSTAAAGKLDLQRKDHCFGSVRSYLIPSNDAPNPTPWIKDPAKPLQDIKYSVNSVIVSGKLGKTLPLDKLAKNGINLSFNPQNFKGLLMRLKEHPEMQIMVFESGYIIVSGGKNVKNAMDAARLTCKKLIAWGATNAKLFNLRVNNISTTVRLDFKIHMPKLLEDGYRVCKSINPVQLDPHSFSGVCLTVSLSNTQCTVVVFATGAILITGVTEESMITRVISRVYPFLRMYAT